jgi:hypothetical protein
MLQGFPFFSSIARVYDRRGREFDPTLPVWISRTPPPWSRSGQYLSLSAPSTADCDRTRTWPPRACVKPAEIASSWRDPWAPNSSIKPTAGPFVFCAEHYLHVGTAAANRSGRKPSLVAAAAAPTRSRRGLARGALANGRWTDVRQSRFSTGSSNPRMFADTEVASAGWSAWATLC